jgi:hypothetical protein
MGQNRRYARSITPEWARTLGGMIDHKTIVRASCRTCKTVFKVEVDLLMAKYGRDYSLYGRTGSCRVYNCDGKCIFLASPHEGTPLRPLLGDD